MATETLKDNCIIETTSSVGDMVVETINLGSDDERKRFSFSGRIRKNTSTTIGTLRIDADTNKRFAKIPGLKPYKSNKLFNLNSNLKLKFKSAVKDTSGNITACLYDLIYNGKENVSKTNNLKYDLIHDAVGIVTKILGIDRVVFTNTYVNKLGDNRKITVYGSPDAEFEIAVNSYTDSTEIITHDDGTTSKHLVNSTETSILNNSNSTYDGVKTLKDNLNSKGFYSFNQSFPKIMTVLETAINGSITDSTRAVLDDVTGVQVGDELIISGATGGASSSTITAINTGGKYVDLFSPVTGANDAEARFYRKTRYSINVKPTIIGNGFNKSLWTESPPGWGGWYGAVLSQNINPILNLQATLNSGETDTINTSGTDVTINTANPYNLIYKGRYGTDTKKIRRMKIDEISGKNESIINGGFDLNYVIKTTGSFAFQTDKEDGPVFSLGSDSDWTNTSPTDNSGTILNISTLSAPVIDNSASPSTCTIKMRVNIDRWGTENVIMSLNLNDILVIS